MAPDDEKMAICLEFGTSGTAVAAQWNNIFSLFEQWPHKPVTSFKLPSVVSVDKNGVKQFGFEALQETQDPVTMMYNIKMELRKKSSGNETDIVQIIGEYLRYVCKASIAKLKNKYMHIKSDSQIQWIATVPAIWTDVENSKMRRALEYAGLPVNDHSRFLFIREPEAAAVSAVVKFEPIFKKPVTFMVIDAGAGTIDTTVFHFDPHTRKFTEICVPMGNAWGSSTLDEEFFNQLQKAYGKAFMKDLKLTNEYSRLRNNWIMLKHGTSNSQLKKKVFVTVVDRTPFEKHNIPVGRNGIELGFTYEDVYEPVLKHVDQLLSEIIEKVLKHNDIDFVYHVGGFAQSDVYRTRVDTRLQQFNPNIKSFSEPNEAQSVIHGGTEYALLMQKYQFNRIMKYTYGLDLIFINSNLRHPVHCKKENGNDVCYNAFSVIVKNGTVMPHGTIVQQKVQPHDIGQTGMLFTVYKSTNPNIQFTSEAEASQIGYLHVNLFAPANEQTSTVVTIYFGADMYATVVDEKNRLLGNATFEFVKGH